MFIGVCIMEYCMFTFRKTITYNGCDLCFLLVITYHGTNIKTANVITTIPTRRYIIQVGSPPVYNTLT